MASDQAVCPKPVKDTLVPISEVVHVWLQHLFCKVECHSLSVVSPGRFLLCYLVAPVFLRAEGCSDDHFTWETKRTTRLFLKRIGPSSPVFRRIKPASKINILVAIPVESQWNFAKLLGNFSTTQRIQVWGWAAVYWWLAVAKLQILAVRRQSTVGVLVGMCGSIKIPKVTWVYLKKYTLGLLGMYWRFFGPGPFWWFVFHITPLGNRIIGGVSKKTCKHVQASDRAAMLTALGALACNVGVMISGLITWLIFESFLFETEFEESFCLQGFGLHQSPIEWIHQPLGENACSNGCFIWHQQIAQQLQTTTFFVVEIEMNLMYVYITWHRSWGQLSADDIARARVRLTREDSSESEKKERLDVRWFLDGTAKYNLK